MPSKKASIKRPERTYRIAVLIVLRAFFV